MTVSERLSDHAEVRRGQLILAISGHQSEASLRNYNGRPSSKQLRVCSYPFRCVGQKATSQQPSFTALLSRAHLSRAISVPVSNCYVEKTRVFQFGRISLNISLRDSVLKTKKHRAKVLISTSRIIFFLLEGVTDRILPIPSKNHVFHRNRLVCIGCVWSHVRCRLALYRVFIDQVSPFIALLQPSFIQQYIYHTITLKW